MTGTFFKMEINYSTNLLIKLFAWLLIVHFNVCILHCGNDQQRRVLFKLTLGYGPTVNVSL